MPKEGRFYVEYLGWKETRGVHGSEFTDPILRKLISKRQSTRKLHRMTIKVNKYEIQISQEKIGSSGKSQKIKYPAQPMEDVSYVSQSAPPHTDVVGCIFLGYNMQTHCAAHVHAYRFDSSDTATIFVKLINSIIEQAEYRQRILAIEKDLAALGQLSGRSVQTGQQLTVSHDTMGSDAGSYGSHSPNSSDSGLARSYPTADEALKQRKDIVIKRSPSQRSVPEKEKMYTNVQDELHFKLAMQQKKEAPILLPPKDYDTIVRRHGHLSIRAKLKPRSIIGANSIFKDSSAATGDGNNNLQSSSGLRLQREVVREKEDSETGSTHSSIGDEPSVYGLYKGLNDDHTLIPDEMAMWSPEFSFGHETASSGSSGFNSSSGSGLRRVKVASNH